jgi:hypothetical protein
MGEDMFLQVEQIIPLPETKEFMIDAKEKEKEEKDKSKVVAESEARLIKFWGNLKDYLRKHDIDYLNNVSAKPSYSIGFWKGAGKFAFCIGKFSIRVELYFSNDNDKEYIDAMSKYKSEIDNDFLEHIVWERLENKKASRIKYELSLTEFKKIGDKFMNEDNWIAWISWYADSMHKFYNTIFPIWEKVQKELDK